MEFVRNFLRARYAGGTLTDWAIALILVLATTIVLAIVKGWVVRRLARWSAQTETYLDDVVGNVLASTRFFFYLAIGIWVGARQLDLSQGAERWLGNGVMLATLLQIGIWMQNGVRGLSEGWRTRRGDDGGTKTMAAASVFVSSLAIWAVLLITALSTLGFEISALVAGLGVGGVAAALAVQNVLGDIFASLSIYFDRPFDIGDFIIVGSEMGTVERVGLRTTRMRSLGGEEIVFGNGDLTKSRIRNYKRMRERRIVFGFGVEYGTSVEALEGIPALVRSIIESRKTVRFDRAHFKEYGDFSLNFEVVYYVLSPDFAVYMDEQQAINFALFRQFAERKIQFAFPTRTLLLHPQGAWASDEPRALGSKASSPPAALPSNRSNP